MQHPRTLARLSILAAALFPLHAFASETIQSFDGVPLGVVHPGDYVRVDGVTVSTRGGTTAAVKPVVNPDELASGNAIGAIDDGSAASLTLRFAKPQPSVSFTVVLPPSASPASAVASVLNARQERRQVVGIEHGTAERRVRVRLHGDNGARIDQIAVDLAHGAFIDNVTIDTVQAGDGYVIDPALLAQGSLVGQADNEEFVVTPPGQLVVTTDPTSGTPMLTSRLATGNDVHFIFKGRREAIEVIFATPALADAQFEFLATNTGGGGQLRPIHQTAIHRGDRRACFKAPLGTELQALHWTGGNLDFGKIELRSTPSGTCETH